MRKTLLTLGALCATLLAPLALHSPLAQVAPTTVARVIVKYKADSALARSKQGLSLSVAQQVNPAEAMGRRMGLALRPGAGVGDRTHVVFANGITSAQLAQRLAAESDVEYAVPDQRRRAATVPNDSLYGASAAISPQVGQWYLRTPDLVIKSAINAEAAWAITTGSSDVVVAVLDSGVRFEHPDMKKLAAGGNLLDGYDMIADLDTSNDGNGRDADASDPGSWISQADLDSGKFSSACTAIEDSSWHGTQTAALIGALTDNATGMASVGRRVQVLPVRVLGKCGGWDSDIQAAMQWAAGIAVPGVPNNTHPAWVINMSLGGVGTCDTASTQYASIISAINEMGRVVVVSAGNDYGQAVNTPANCPGVIAVGGLRHAGTKNDFSDLGPEVAISAPGGNCVTSGPCQYPILTATNLGKTTPGASDYTSGIGIPSIGTSFSAPLVAGTAALMLSANPTLTPAAVKAILQSSARAFPTAALVPACVAPNGVEQDECNCTTSTCGAGMLDAGMALASVLNRAGLVANITVSTPNPAIGMPVELSAAASVQTAGGGNPTYLWEIVDDGGIVGAFSSPTNTAITAKITPTAAGRFVVKLTVTDSNGGADTIADVYVPGPTAPPPPADSGGGAVGVGWLMLLLTAVLALRSGRRKT